MDGKVGAHPLVHKVVLHIGPDKGKLLFYGQFAGQSCLNLAGKLAVPGFLDLLHAVPEGGAVCGGAWAGSMISAWTTPPFRV